MIEIEEDTLLLEKIPEAKTIQEGHVEDQIISEKWLTGDRKGYEVNLDPLPEDLEI